MSRRERHPPRYASRRSEDLFRGPSIGEEKQASIEGVLETVTFVNEESGWSVIRLRVGGRRDLVAVVGYLPGVRPGESLRLHGRWVKDRRYGEQFEVQSFVTVQPSTLLGMERYLSSGLIRGIGKVTASRLVGHFGLDTLEVIDRHPERLEEVEGIGPKKRVRIAAAWAEQRAVREVMLFLQSHGVSPAFAAKIYRRYKNRAISLVKENPFRLASDIPGIGFLTADRIAAALGIPPDAPQRAEAGVLYTLGEFSEEGHLYAPRRLLEDRAAGTLEIDHDLVVAAVEALESRQEVVIERTVEDLPVYLASIYDVECHAAERLRELMKSHSPPVSLDIDKALDWFEKQEDVTFAEPQREAVRRVLAGRILVITGGPGTGKTTIVKAIVTIFEKKDRKVLLCAPTGRASKRLEEATGREARTIHRLLEFNPGRQRFERDAARPLEADMIVVDEMSMVDALLFASLLDAVPPDCQLVLVGDVDQLPSVGPGNVLRDLIGSRAIDVVVLTEIFRQASKSLIVVNAHRINRGEMPRFSEEDRETGDFFFIQKDSPSEGLETIKELVSQRIPARFDVDAIDDIQVLTPMHKGELGATNLNVELQQLLNPAGEKISRGARHFRRGDKVMQIRNNYDLGVYNGDLGRVDFIDQDEQKVSVRFEGRLVVYDWADLDELVLGYACSIHKSQGSEYPVVVMALHTQHYALLQRNLLYTGITRGKRLVVVVGTKKALGIAVRNHRVSERYTRLAERLAQEDLHYDGLGPDP